MAVTVKTRPTGYKLSAPLGCDIFNSIGYAGVSIGPHGLSENDVVYIESNVDSYNGYKYVHIASSTIFYILNEINGAYIPFKQAQDDVIDGCLCYKTNLTHGWQSVHLPIPYTLNSNLNPNILDAVVAVGGVGNDNGYIALNIPVISLVALDYATIVTDKGPSQHQVINVVDHSTYLTVTFNLAYNAFSGWVSVQKYYNNYFIAVDVYAGIQSGNRWTAEKPFEVATTLKLIPDSIGNVKFSIAEILKGYINLKNNLLIDSFPNNIDFLSEFYIQFTENYDVSDGTTVTQFTGPLSDDSVNFIGQAVNSKMAFKSFNVGFMSDYLYSNTELAQWLTNQDRPQAYVDRFFDLSFINQDNGKDIIITILKKLARNVIDTDTVTYTNPGAGILRIPITPESGFDEYCIQASSSGSSMIDKFSFNNLPGANVDWIKTGVVRVTLPAAAISASDLLVYNFPFKNGISYTIVASFTTSGSASGQLTVQATDASYTAQFSKVDNFAGSSQNVTLTFTANANTKAIAIKASKLTTPQKLITFTGLTIAFTAPVTEQLCMDIVDECATFIDDNLRLTEDARLRKLE